MKACVTARSIWSWIAASSCVHLGLRCPLPRRPGQVGPVGDGAGGDLLRQPAAEVDLVGEAERRVEDQPGARRSARSAVHQVAGEDRRQDQQADADAGVAGGDRPAAVDRERRAPGQRVLGERAQRQREAGADQRSAAAPATPSPLAGQHRQRQPGRRRPGSRPQAARTPGAGARQQPVGDQRPRRHHRHHGRGASGVWPQPLISSSTTRNRAAVSAADNRASARLAAMRGRAASPSSGAALLSQDVEQGEQGERHLDDEDGAPRDERLVSDPPIAGPAAAPRRRPLSRPRRLGRPTAAGRQQLQRRAYGQRPADRLTAAEGQQPVEAGASAQPSEAAANTASPTPQTSPSASAAQTYAAGIGDHRQHQVEQRQHPGHVLDRDVETVEDVGQGEDHDRRVGEHDADDQSQARARAAIPVTQEPIRGARRTVGCCQC